MEEPVNNIPDQDPILNRIADLSPEKRAILVKKLRNRNENIRINRHIQTLIIILFHMLKKGYGFWITISQRTPFI